MTRKDAKRMVDECIEVASEVFTEWEQELLQCIQRHLEAGRTPSDKQIDIIKHLYRKACESPY